MKTSLILASSSAVRARLLQHAGIPFSTVAPDVDEKKIKAESRAQNFTEVETARTLALAKARNVGLYKPNNLVLGADQMLTCQGEWFDKPVGADGVRNHLIGLSGKEHDLINAVVILRNNKILWQYDDTATIEIRQLTKSYIETYIKHAEKAVYQSVGAYDLEGRGVQLMRRIDGDYFSILGLPLFPLIDFLREYGAVPK